MCRRRKGRQKKTEFAKEIFLASNIPSPSHAPSRHQRQKRLRLVLPLPKPIVSPFLAFLLGPSDFKFLLRKDNCRKVGPLGLREEGRRFSAGGSRAPSPLVSQSFSLVHRFAKASLVAWGSAQKAPAMISLVFRLRTKDGAAIGQFKLT